MLRQSVAFHPRIEPIAWVPFGSWEDKPAFCFFLYQPEVQEEQITEIDDQPLDLPRQGQTPESGCPALHSADRTIKKEGQQLPKADPEPVKTIFGLCRRFFRRLHDGGRIAGKHQPGLIQRHRRGEQVKIGRHCEPVQDGTRPVHIHPPFTCKQINGLVFANFCISSIPCPV